MMRKVLSPNRLLVFVTLCAVLGLLGVFFPLGAEVVEAPAAEYVWTPPEYGSPVDHYVAQVMVNDVDILTMEPLPSEFARVEVVFGNKYRIRVAAVDADGTQGPYSSWSAPYTPELAPPEF